MPTFNSQMFFLGNFADMDTNEADTIAETPEDILGTYVLPTLIDVDVNDGNGDGQIQDDELGTTPGEDVVYDAGSGTTTQFIDSTIVYNIRVTENDGSTTDILATVIQLQNGDVLLTDFANNGSLDNLSVRNIELLSVSEANYGAFFANSSVDNTQVVCFAYGTPIMTDTGPMSVECITTGTQVLTSDHGFQPCLATTHHRLHTPGRKRAPIRIAADALGKGLPAQPLRLSPQHRVLLSSPIIQRMFGQDEVLLAAKELLCLEGVTQALPILPVCYTHLLFARHEIVSAAGLPTESLFAGEQARKALPDGPHLSPRMRAARMIIKGKRAKKMLARYCQNHAAAHKPLSREMTLPLHPCVGAFASQNALEPAGFIQ